MLCCRMALWARAGPFLWGCSPPNQQMPSGLMKVLPGRRPVRMAKAAIQIQIAGGGGVSKSSRAHLAKQGKHRQTGGMKREVVVQGPGKDKGTRLGSLTGQKSYRSIRGLEDQAPCSSMTSNSRELVAGIERAQSLYDGLNFLWQRVACIGGHGPIAERPSWWFSDLR
jgi:hypothetical protein